MYPPTSSTSNDGSYARTAGGEKKLTTLFLRKLLWRAQLGLKYPRGEKFLTPRICRPAGDLRRKRVLLKNDWCGYFLVKMQMAISRRVKQYLLALGIVGHETRRNAGIPSIYDSARGVEIYQKHLIGNWVSKSFVTTSPFVSFNFVWIVIVMCYIR